MVNYKALMILPIILLVLSIVYVTWASFTQNLKLDIDLKGGTQITLESADQQDISSIENSLKDFNPRVRTARGVSGWSTIINVPSDKNPKEITAILESSGISYTGISVQTIGAELGKTFFSQAQLVLLLAFIFMAITVFIIFRIPMPSFYVVLAGFSDLIEALAISQILGVELSLATFAALLLLIGYSVDTDILLTARVMKGDGPLDERIKGARKTGLTMTAAAIASMVALFLMSSATVIAQISSILVIGLVVDVINTWIMNAGLLRFYVEKKGLI